MSTQRSLPARPRNVRNCGRDPFSPRVAFPAPLPRSAARSAVDPTMSTRITDVAECARLPSSRVARLETVLGLQVASFSSRYAVMAEAIAGVLAVASGVFLMALVFGGAGYAYRYVRSRAEMYDADPNFHEKYDIHIHVPEGAIPKDGPSAGITMAASLFSAVTKIPVLKDVAMTGEITLRGKVLPVGGIKDKVLAAYRAGIRTIVLSAENDKDLDDLPEEIRSQMEFHLVSNMDEVIKIAMEDVPPTAATLEAETRPAEGGALAH